MKGTKKCYDDSNMKDTAPAKHADIRIQLNTPSMAVDEVLLLHHTECFLELEQKTEDCPIAAPLADPS